MTSSTFSDSSVLRPQLLERALVVRFARPHRCLSWAIVGGGQGDRSAVVWAEVRNSELPVGVDARELLRRRLRAVGAPDAVGLLTSRQVNRFVHTRRDCQGVGAQCVATVGLSNALRAGDPVGVAQRLGTINVLCHLSVPLTEEGLLEALALVSEARAVAVMESEATSRLSHRPASGTGTDCLVVAAPLGPAAVCFAGKHTAAGHVVGEAVRAAVEQGCAQWHLEQGSRKSATDSH